MRDKYRILVVDDEKNTRRGLSKILTKFNYEVLEAETGEKALECLEENHCDILITDMRMPGISGIDLLKNVRKNAPDIGVIIFTGFPTAYINRFTWFKFFI